MELKAGYKSTRVGVIPEDWTVEPLGRMATLRTGPFGSTLHESDYVEGGVPVINPMHIIDGRLEPTPGMTVSSATAARLYEFQVQPGDVVIGRRGDMGRCAVIEASQTGWLCGTGSMIVRSSSAHPGFLQRVLSSKRAIESIEATSVGSTMINLNQVTLSGLSVQFPPLEEQRAIATALSDVDALLGAIDRLIAKKRNLKRAAMQQLLTGQTRLPGFNGEWKVRRLGDHATFLKHGVNSRAELTTEGRVKYLHYGDVHGAKGLLLNPTLESMPCLPSMKAEGIDRLMIGDLVIADASEDLDGVGKSVELTGVGTVEVVSGLHTIAVRFDKRVLADGFKAYLQFCAPFRAQLRRLAAGTKVYATNRSHVASVEIALPNVEEQSAIASVLSDMDAEIEALDARRAKTRDIKQAMMQELLTGRTRLV
ncbi:MAG: hypothetical protein AMXMBFR57_15700 [Acidimicrobiia bacterium]